MPFYGISSVYAFIRNGIKESDIQGKKDVYYDVKNNEFIDRRSLLLLHAKRMQYLLSRNQRTIINGKHALIFDDTFLAKTGIKAEKVSRTFDHVSGQWIFGYKLLECGFWDGVSFISLNFSFHCEKGKANEDLIQALERQRERITCLQSFSGLFESISKEMVSLDLVSRIIVIIWELVEGICSIAGIDFIELQKQLIKDERATATFINMLPQRTLDKVA